MKVDKYGTEYCTVATRMEGPKDQDQRVRQATVGLGKLQQVSYEATSTILVLVRVLVLYWCPGLHVGLLVQYCVNSSLQMKI